MTPENLRAYVDAHPRAPARYVAGLSLRRSTWSARALLDAGRPLAAGPPRARCFTSSESLLAFQRETIEQAFGAPVRDRYGVSEFCVSMTECRERRLHVDMEFGIVEVEVEEESEDWVRGPLLVTGLRERRDAAAALPRRRRRHALEAAVPVRPARRRLPRRRRPHRGLRDDAGRPPGRAARPHLQGAARRRRGADRSRRRRDAVEVLHRAARRAGATRASARC